MAKLRVKTMNLFISTNIYDLQYSVLDETYGVHIQPTICSKNVPALRPAILHILNTIKSFIIADLHLIFHLRNKELHFISHYLIYLRLI